MVLIVKIPIIGPQVYEFFAFIGVNTFYVAAFCAQMINTKVKKPDKYLILARFYENRPVSGII